MKIQKNRFTEKGWRKKDEVDDEGREKNMLTDHDEEEGDGDDEALIRCSFFPFLFPFSFSLEGSSF